MGIFISHSSQDNDIALELERRLIQRNFHSVFLDLDPTQGIVAGQSWEQTLYRKLRACRAVIALCSDHYLPSHWCFAEIALARMEGKQIFALLIDPLSPEAQLPSILTEKQFIDLRQDPEEGYQRLWLGLEAMNLVGVPGEWDPQQPPYLGLSAYQEKHAPIFCGREAEIRSGLELLGRGAPSLILVLGASGSGKSSLVRAGIVPRLRRNPEQWLVVNPFRPGQDPVRELADVLAQTYRRYIPSQVEVWGEPEQILATLMADAETDPVQVATHLSDQDLLTGLLEQLESLYQQPFTDSVGQASERSLRDFLDGRLDDLRRICARQSAQVPAAAPVAAGSTPLLTVVEHLRRNSPYPQARVLLVIDQFEELLGRQDPADPRNRFLALLLASLAAAPQSLMVLATMRSDLLGEFQRNPLLRGVDFESLSVGPMSVDGMRRIIETPAQLGAITLEPGLADRLLADTETSDALPLLSFTLWVLWRDYRDDGKLEVHEYEELGGLYGAIAKEADALLLAAQRSNREPDLQQAFIRLVKLTADGNYARRPVAWDAPELQPVQDLLERFVEQRLLVFRANREQRQVEVAHEALFRTWHPLKTWLDSHRAELLFKQQLTDSAHQWEQQQRSNEYLWRGARLQQAQDLLQHQALSEVEQAFIATAVRQRQRRRLSVLGITGGVILSLMVSLGFALDQLQRAQIDQIRTYIAFSDANLAYEHLVKAQENSIQAGKALLKTPLQRLFPDPLLQRQVLSQLQSTAYRVTEQHRMETYQNREIVRVALNPKSGHLASAATDGTVWLWHAQAGVTQLPLPTVANAVPKAWGIHFSPDGHTLATVGVDGSVMLWDPHTSTPRQRLPGHTDRISAVVFSPDSHQLATASQDGTIRLWNVHTGTQLMQLQGPKQGVLSLDFSADNQYLLTSSAGGSVHRWRLADGQQMQQYQGHRGEVHQAVLHLPTQRLATIERTGTTRIWDLDQQKSTTLLQPRSETGAPLKIVSLDFSHDGVHLVTSDQAGQVSFWLTKTGEPVTQLSGAQGHVSSVKFSQDGKQLATGNKDGKTIIWDTSQLETQPQQSLKALLALNCRQLQQRLQAEPDEVLRDRNLCTSILSGSTAQGSAAPSPLESNPKAKNR